MTTDNAELMRYAVAAVESCKFAGLGPPEALVAFALAIGMVLEECETAESRALTTEAEILEYAGTLIQAGRLYVRRTREASVS